MPSSALNTSHDRIPFHLQSQHFYPASITTSPTSSPSHFVASTAARSPPAVATAPRSASLGPAARLNPRTPAVPLLYDPSHTTEPLTTFTTTTTAPDHLPKNSISSISISPEQRRRLTGAPSHSRSNSTNNLRDAASNFNRWSQSTSSSKGSSEHKRSRSFSRRLSLATNPFSSNNAAATSNSPNKLQKGRPLNERSPPRPPPAPLLFESSIPPPQLLPPIVSLPTLQQAVGESAFTLSTVNSSTPSPGLLSASANSATTDFFGRQWEESSNLSPRPPIESPNADARSTTQTFVTTTDQTDASAELRMGEESEPNGAKGHSRNRSQAEKGSASSTRSRERSHKRTSQKAMLSKALQKANTAVLLDNAQNFEGAMQAYSEACDLLEQVMGRSSGNDDKRKLEAIRNTYRSRIIELEKITPQAAEDEQKALPARPQSKDEELSSPVGDYEADTAIIETATVTRIVNDPSMNISPMQAQNQPPTSRPPPRRESLMPSPMADQYRTVGASESRLGGDYPPRSFSKSPMRERVVESRLNLPPMERDYMPPPLSPRRTITPSRDFIRPDVTLQAPPSLPPPQNPIQNSKGHKKVPSNESMSWLDTIDESSASEISSVHSRTSSLRIRRKHIRAPSGATEAEFDAALDAAVEAAYDDGYEPEPLQTMYDDDEIVANVRRRVELAKERVRQTELETEREAAIQLARERERQRVLQAEQDSHGYSSLDMGTESEEEEERMLEEMTKSYVLDDFEFGLQSKFSVPRESDSSGFSGRTWSSSAISNPTTAGTRLSSVTEGIPSLPNKPRTSPPTQPLPPQPTAALPSPPNTLSSSAPATNGITAQSVRSRRLSGQNPKQLKIETAAITPSSSSSLEPFVLGPSKTPGTQTATSKPISIPQFPPSSAKFEARRQASSPFPGPSPSDMLPPPTPTLAQPDIDADGFSNSRSGSPARAQSRTALRKNQSSSSLKNFRSRNLSVSVDESSDISPNTPISNPYSAASREYMGRLPSIPTLPTPIATAFRDKMNGVPTPGTGLSLFDSDIHSPQSPGSPTALSSGAPVPLEPCPTEHLLRPFWLMRALYQTITHPRGGYLSTKLFIPNDVWKVKNVKLKGIEDKIANCDFLTAALLNLAKVDTCDADAVLDEMQAIETVLEQVQAALSKKLGNEVGVQGSGGLFKDAAVGGEDGAAIGSRSASTSGKTAFSWRRLRSKNSGATLSTYGGKSAAVPEGPKEVVALKSVPMTSQPFTKFLKRELNQAQFIGPNAMYMNSLARLFDAAQVIDQIARQVEDPGLRHADKTQVGLELCVRHAAEFFGFYICRFVLTDIGMLLDKFIKRGSEWVVV